MANNKDVLKLKYEDDKLTIEVTRQGEDSKSVTFKNKTEVLSVVAWIKQLLNAKSTVTEITGEFPA